MEEQKSVAITTKLLGLPFVERLQALLSSRFGAGLLALVACIESLLPVPILTEPFLVGTIMLNRAKALQLVMVTMIGSVIGGTIAFSIAVVFRDFLLATLTPETRLVLDSFIGGEQGTFLLTIIGAITPVPYTVVAWAVAFSAGNILVFIIASILGRSIRYGIVGWCTYRFGPLALRYAKRSILWTSLAVFVLVGLYIWFKM